MRLPTARRLAACAAAFLLVQTAALVRPAEAAAQATLHACYVPKSGTVYRIKAPNTPTACTKNTHAEFSWQQAATPAPAGPRAVARVLENGSLDPRSRGIVAATRKSTGTYCLTPAEGISPASDLAIAVSVDPDRSVHAVWDEELDWDKIGACEPGQYGVSVFSFSGIRMDAEFVLTIP